jgi:predicted transposase YbfD/YdcC
VPTPRLFPPEEAATLHPKRCASTLDKDHGRSERRTLWTTTVLTLHEKWAGLQQGLKIRRERTINGQTTVEIVYGITSLSEEQADATQLLELVRTHWQIENCLHYVRDVTLGEDACRVRRGQAPQVLAALRNAVVHLLAGKTVGEDQSRAAVLRHNAANIDQPMQLIGIPWLE